MGSGNQNMFGAMNFHENGLIHEQHYSLVNGGRLVVELNIEGPNGASNFGPNGVGGTTIVNDSSQGDERCVCGRKRKNRESEDIFVDIDLNQIPIYVDHEELYCECENPSMQGTGNLTLHATSDSLGHINQQSQSNLGGSHTEIRVADSPQHGRSHLLRRRRTPHRLTTSVPGGSNSGEIPSHAPPSIASVSAAASISVAAPTTVAAPTAAPMSVATPTRICDILLRRDFLHALINSEALADMLRTLVSVLGQQPFHSPSLIAAPLYDTQGMTLGQTSNGGHIHFTQPYMQFSNLHLSADNQPESSLTSNVALNFIANPTQMVEQLHHHAPGIFMGNLNQGQFVGPATQSSSGVNRRDPRLNIQPTGNVLPGVDSNLHGAITVNNDSMDPQATQGPPMYQGHEVIEISDDDDENDEFDESIDDFDELDDMLLDIDEMSYEELLELGERIGVVNTGLTEEVIMERLIRRYYRVVKNRPPEAAESCCICLVEFVNRDVLGRINCTHKFHFDCIKEWLKEKNFCPICKQTALPEN